MKNNSLQIFLSQAPKLKHKSIKIIKLFSRFMRVFYNCVLYFNIMNVFFWTYVLIYRVCTTFIPIGPIYPSGRRLQAEQSWMVPGPVENQLWSWSEEHNNNNSNNRGAWRPSRGWQWPPTVTTCGVWPPSTVTTAWPPGSLQCHQPPLVTTFSPSSQPITNPSKQLQWATWRS